MSEPLNPGSPIRAAAQTTSLFTDDAAVALGVNLLACSPTYDNISLPGGYTFGFYYCEVYLDFLIGSHPTRNVPVRFPVEVVSYGAGMKPDHWRPLAAFPRTNLLMMNGVLGPNALLFDSNSMYG